MGQIGSWIIFLLKRASFTERGNKMEIGAAAGTAVAEHVATRVADSIWEQILYVFHYDGNIKNLEAKVQTLELAKRRVNVRIKAAQEKLQNIQEDVIAWLDSVDKEIANASEILEDDAKAKKSYCCDLLPDVTTRYVFSRRAADKALLLSNLATQSQFRSIGYVTPIKGFVPPTHFEAFESREGIFESIVELLKQEKDANVVGVWGPGGVGKTTLVKKVAERVEAEKVFKTIILASATVTHNPVPDLTMIMKDIAKCLNFDLGDGSGEARASRLFERLKLEKSILIILDDAWREVELDKIGIRTGGKDENRVCKVLVTSRSKQVVLGIGATERSCLNLEGLYIYEGWKLLRKTVGHMEDPKIIPVAQDIVIRCAGLPVLLLPVAKALKNKKLYVWENALDQLKKLDGTSEMDEKTYAALELSYNFLDEDMKKTFLLAAKVGPGGTDLDSMLIYATGWGLFENLETVAQVRNRLHSVMDNLVSSSMLTEPRGKKYRMHDVVQSFAISLICKNGNYVMSLSTNFGQSLRKWPKDEMLNKCTSISLAFCKIPKFLDVLPCPNLEMLLLGFATNTVSLPMNFFRDMKNLKVLDLTQFNLCPLPSSLRYLEKLKSLYIYKCLVEDISEIGGLTTLQLLSLSGSTMAYLPPELKGLCCLRRLDLAKCINLKKIPTEILQYWTELEELDISDSSIELDDAVLIALRNLSTTLER